MILADKIMTLRKKNGWSQEDLAEKIAVSRQSVSKWEGAQSVPDLNKVLQLSQVFGVTTDYLLKDEIEQEEFLDDQLISSAHKVSLTEAHAYLRVNTAVAGLKGLATFLSIIMTAPLIILTTLASQPDSGVNEAVSEAFGTIIAFLCVSLAVMLFMLCHAKYRPYRYLDTAEHELEYGVKGVVQVKQKEYAETYARFQMIGILLCILSPMIVVLSAITDNEIMISLSIPAMLFGIASGVCLLIIGRERRNAMKKLLKEGVFAQNQIRTQQKLRQLSTIYWLLAVVIYLMVSFLFHTWSLSRIIFPISGILYAALIITARYIIEKEDRK